MTVQPLEIAPCQDPSDRPDVSAEALRRPQELKNWSADLVAIVKGQETAIFEGFSFLQERLTRADLTRTLRKMTGCGSVVELRAKVDRNTGEMGSPALHAANFCGQHAICPYCAARVQDRRKARFRDPIMTAARTYAHAYLVTATIPPVPTWREDLNLLISGWRSFRKMGQRRKGRKAERSRGEWGKIQAGISKVELKRGEGSGLPHCHVHALFFTDDPLDYRVWDADQKRLPPRLRRPRHRIPFDARRARWKVAASRHIPFLPLPWWRPSSKIVSEWYAATGDSATGLNVQKIKWRAPKRRPNETGRVYRAREAEWSLSDSVYEQAREVLKYATKFDSAPATGAERLFAKDFIGIKAATYGRRLFQTYGAFRSVGGDDFTGGACPLAENPVIYEARWRTNRYSPLMERTRPVFPNCEPGPNLTARLQALNRVQGATRRTRSAILEARRAFLSGEGLRPAPFVHREYLPEGGFVESPAPLEVPGYVLAAPESAEAWERWMDDATDAGRAAYAAMREHLDLESHHRIVGTPEERRVAMEAGARLYRLTNDYRDAVTNSFLQVLAASPPPS